MYQCEFLLLTLLVGSCRNENSMLDATLPMVRTVSTSYEINSRLGRVNCYARPNATSKVRTKLAHKQIVDLVSAKEKMLFRSGEYWLYVIPRLSHRPGCYINTRHLIPLPTAI